MRQRVSNNLPAVRSGWRTGALVMMGLAAPACGGSWTAIRQADPNPLIGHKSFAVPTVSFEGLLVEGVQEAQYLSGKPAEEQRRLAAEKEAFTQSFLQAAAASGTERGLNVFHGSPTNRVPFMVRANVTSIRCGPSAEQTEVRMNVQILDARGQTVDEISFHVARSKASTDTAVVRLQAAAQRLGADLASYLESRT